MLVFTRNCQQDLKGRHLIFVVDVAVWELACHKLKQYNAKRIDIGLWRVRILVFHPNYLRRLQKTSNVFHNSCIKLPKTVFLHDKQHRSLAIKYAMNKIQNPVQYCKTMTKTPAS